MSSNVQKFVTAVVAPIQLLLDTCQAIKVQRNIDDAVGAQLDVIGKIVDQPRNGLEDEDYRRYLRARIAAHRSDGLVKDIIKVARLIVNDPEAYIRVGDMHMAELTLNIEDSLVAGAVVEVVRDFMQDVVLGGVRIVVRYWPQPAASSFTLSRAGETSVPALGLGSSGAFLTGGSLIRAIE